ncbi:MAG: glycoside hydrolase, partial [Candidatus Hydrogenedentes bacterium]|nr:glycoside hydrolase [Candidatus Hydrogenedentota bacterium]
FPCPGSGIAMTRLASGRIVLVYNDSVDERSPLSVAWSTDEGATWAEPLKLEANPGEYSYPCVTQSEDGKIHATYTFRRSSIKHVEFNEDWMDHLKRPN